MHVSTCAHIQAHACACTHTKQEITYFTRSFHLTLITDTYCMDIYRPIQVEALIHNILVGMNTQKV